MHPVRKSNSGLGGSSTLSEPGMLPKASHRKWGGVSESPYKKVGPVSVLGRAR